MNYSNKHVNYEILNLLGYGLSKFNKNFILEFGMTSKSAFYQYCVDIKIAKTTNTIKNRMDLFDPFFPNNRKGWWQKGDAYIHRKQLIDSMFGKENVHEYANIVKLYLQENFNVHTKNLKFKPIIKSRFKQLQKTGLEAELYFMYNYNSIDIFNGAELEDARLLGDGYDFQLSLNNDLYLAEVKGIRESKGKFRLTENEYLKANEYKSQYFITLVLNMNDSPKFLLIDDPIKNLQFEKVVINSKKINEYHLKDYIC